MNNELLGENVEKFRADSKLVVDYICNYGYTVGQKTVVPSVKPGYLRPLLPAEAPEEPEDVKEILNDFDKLIMPGTLHWMHPNFYAYFPGGNAYPNILGDMLSTAIGGNGFSWSSQPSLTELENVMLDWYGRALDLPKFFLFEDSKGVGGGCIQNSASDAIFATILAARNIPLMAAGCYPPSSANSIHPGDIVSKLVCYASREAHSCVQKGANIALCTIRVLVPNEKNEINGELLEKQILMDKKNGLIPFYCCATLGSTGSAAFDHLASIGPICKKYKLWLHVDGSYGGNAFILPEMRHLKEGIDCADSFTVNPYKLLLGAVDLNCMWVKDTTLFKNPFIINATYLIDQEDEGERTINEIDYRHYGIPLSRRMRALKLWFLFRCYGVRQLQRYVRSICDGAKVFEALVREDKRFEVCDDVKVGLVCFRQKDLSGRTDTFDPALNMTHIDKLNVNLLLRVNNSRLLHICPCSLQGQFVLRFSINNEFTTVENIQQSWKNIQSMFVSELDDDLKTYFGVSNAQESYRKASRLAFTRTLESREYFDYKKELENQIPLTFSSVVIPHEADVTSLLRTFSLNEDIGGPPQSSNSEPN